MLAAAALFVVLAGMVVAIVVATIPAGRGADSPLSSRHADSTDRRRRFVTGLARLVPCDNAV